MNKVILIGLVGKDLEVRRFESGDMIANFSLATSERWTDKNGDKQESTEWHNIVASKKFAELAEKYIAKGSKIMIVGKIKQRSWESDNGKKYITEIHMSEIEFLSKKSDSVQSPEVKKDEPKPKVLPEDTYDPSDDLPF